MPARLCASVAIAFGMGGLLGVAQQPPPSLRGATITGRVVHAVTHQPLRGAIVSAGRLRDNPTAGAHEIAFRTGLDGRFVLREVAPGIVNFYVTKTGYLRGPYTSVRPATDGERIEDVVLTVLPAASVSGRVTTEIGEPVLGAAVTVRPRTAAPNSVARPPTATVDDQGRYWVGELAAGEYVISTDYAVRPVRAGQPDLPAPGQSLTLTLATGEERTGVDLTFRAQPPDIAVGRPLADRGTGSVSGRVVDTRGQVIAKARVSLATSQQGGLVTTTDAAGEFRFEDLPAGRFSIAARRSDYLGGPAGVSATASITVPAAGGIDGVVLTLRNGGAITGTITDEFGDPVSARAMAVLVSSVADVLRAPGRTTTSDAHGRYRIAGLGPGEYVVLIDQTVAGRELHVEDQSGQDRIVATMPVFYPGAPTASLASKVSVSENGETAGIDVVLRLAPAATIEVTLAPGRQVNSIQLQQFSLDEHHAAYRRITTSLTKVTLDAVPAGRYRVIASAEPVVSNDEKATRLWSSTEVTTDGLSPYDLAMSLEPGANVSGRLIFEGGSARREVARAWLVPMLRLPGASIALAEGNATVEAASGEFTIEGILPGSYVLQAGERSVALPASAGAPAGPRRDLSTWILKSAMIGGRDVLDVPTDLYPGADFSDAVLTLTDRVSELSGIVTDEAGGPATNVSVIVFSANRQHWWRGSRRVAAARADLAGRYLIRGLPTGTYLIATVADLNILNTDDLTSMLTPLVGKATRIVLADGERKIQNLRIAVRRAGRVLARQLDADCTPIRATNIKQR